MKKIIAGIIIVAIVELGLSYATMPLHEILHLWTAKLLMGWEGEIELSWTGGLYYALKKPVLGTAWQLFLVGVSGGWGTALILLVLLYPVKKCFSRFFFGDPLVWAILLLSSTLFGYGILEGMPDPPRNLWLLLASIATPEVICLILIHKEIIKWEQRMIKA